MTPVPTLRPIEEADLPFLEAVYASTRLEELEATDWTPQQKQAFLHMQFRAQHAHYTRHYPTAQFMVILVNNECAGRFYVDEWDKELRIVDIALLPEHRGRGVGSYLLDATLERAHGARKSVTIHVEKLNPALALYRRKGFVEAEDKGVYWLMRWMPTLT